MIPSILLAAAVAAAPGAGTSAAAKGPVKLGAPGFSGLNIPDNAVNFYTDHFAQQLTMLGIRVITASEIATLIGFDRQKQLLGCSENSTSCMAELANALGVDGIVTGSIGKFGNAYQVNVKILSATDATPLAVHSGRVTGDEGLLDELSRAARAMSSELFRRLGRQPDAGVAASAAPAMPPRVEATADSSGGGGVRRWAWVPAAGGVLAAAGGAYFYSQAVGNLNLLQTRPSAAVAFPAYEQGKAQQTVAFALFSAAGAALVGAGTMYLLGDSSGPQPVAWGGPSGAGLGVAGALP